MGPLTDADQRGPDAAVLANLNPYGRFTIDIDTHLNLRPIYAALAAASASGSAPTDGL